MYNVFSTPKIAIVSHSGTHYTQNHAMQFHTPKSRNPFKHHPHASFRFFGLCLGIHVRSALQNQCSSQLLLPSLASASIPLGSQVIHLVDFRIASIEISIPKRTMSNFRCFLNLLHFPFQPVLTTPVDLCYLGQKQPRPVLRPHHRCLTLYTLLPQY